MKVRILNAEPEGYSEAARTILFKIGELAEERLTQLELVTRVADFDVLIVRLGLQVNRQVLEAGARLRAVVSATTGLDHIDLAAAGERRVAVLSLRGEREFLRSVPATAEHTFALMLALVRRLPWAFDSVRRGEWNRDVFRGHDLAGRRLGILGLGRIGERVAGIARAFEMQVGAHDPYRSGWLEGVKQFPTLEELLRWSEILTIHLPLDETTYGILDERLLRLLPDSAWIINTARGALVDGKALTVLLEKGKLAGAAVDVLEDEFDPVARATDPLLSYARSHGNLVITPHIGGATFDSMARTEIFMAEKLARFLGVNESVEGLPRGQ